MQPLSVARCGTWAYLCPRQIWCTKIASPPNPTACLTGCQSPGKRSAERWLCYLHRVSICCIKLRRLRCECFQLLSRAARQLSIGLLPFWALLLSSALVRRPRFTVFLTRTSTALWSAHCVVPHADISAEVSLWTAGQHATGV